MTEQAWTIRKPPRNLHSFSFLLEGTGISARNARLTYDLIADQQHLRTLLMFTKSRRSQTLSTVLGSANDELERLEERVRYYEGLGRKAVETAKALVNDIYSGSLGDLPNVSVAVHKYGPVPVFVVPDFETPLSLFNNERLARIAIYPAMRSDHNPGSYVSGVSNPFQKLQSYKIQLETMLKRYLEDAGEYCFDIEQHSNLQDFLGNAKKMETVLSESISSKYHDIRKPPTNFPNRSLILKESRELKDHYAHSLIQARMARLFLLYALNRLYSVVGLRSKAPYYLGKLDGLQEASDAAFWAGSFSEARAALPAVKLIGNALRKLRAGDVVEPLSAEETKNALWLRRTIEFAHFTSLVNEKADFRGCGELKPHVFLSHHFTVGTSLALKGAVEDILEKDSRTATELIVVREEEVGKRIRESVRAGIWLSEAVAPIIPAGTKKMGEESESSFRWIAREIEHGKLLRKRIIPFVEKGAETKKVTAHTNDSADFFLCPEACRPKDWKKSIQEIFDEEIFIQFSGDSFPDKELRYRVTQESELVAQTFLKRLIRGLMSQLTEDNCKAIARVHIHTGYPLTRTKLKEIVPGFDSAYTAARKRYFEIGCREYKLIAKHRRRGVHTYSGGLPSLVKAIRPELRPDEVEKVVHDIVSEFVDIDSELR